VAFQSSDCEHTGEGYFRNAHCELNFISIIAVLINNLMKEMAYNVLITQKYNNVTAYAMLVLFSCFKCLLVCFVPKKNATQNLQ